MSTILTDVDRSAEPAAVVAPEARIKLRSTSSEVMWHRAGSAFASFCLTWLLFERVTPLSGGVGFFITWYLLFTVFAWWLARVTYGPQRSYDEIARIVMWTGGLCLIVPLVLILGYVVSKGYHALHASFFTSDERYVGSLSSSKAGGAEHAIIGTIEQVGIALMLSVPLGVATALYLNEVGGRLAQPVRTIVDAMSALPSIVAGLFIFSALIVGMHQNRFYGAAGGLALAVMMLPTVTRTSEIVLRLVPGGLREAGLALGGTDWRTTRSVVLPTARTGIVTAVILGVARIIGETAPLLLTIGGSRFVNWNPIHGEQAALPLFVYNIFRTQHDPQQLMRAWTGALVLVLLVLLLFVVARLIGGRGPGHIGRLKRRRLARKGLA